MFYNVIVYYSTSGLWRSCHHEVKNVNCFSMVAGLRHVTLHCMGGHFVSRASLYRVLLHSLIMQVYVIKLKVARSLLPL